MDKSVSLANALGYQAADKRIEILRLTGQTGSISKAAREAAISYKAAWQAIDTLSNLTGMTLVEKNVGGVGGGGARLTEAGKRLLEMATLFEQRRQRFLNEMAGNHALTAEDGLPSLAIQTSMRNHLLCKVKNLKQTGQIVRVHLELRDGSTLTARITLTSSELLGLKPGLPVIAMCKAMAVKIVREVPGKLDDANLLPGAVCRVSSGSGEDELSIELDSGMQLVGFAPSAEKIGVGEKVFALADESAVVVALLP